MASNPPPQKKIHDIRIHLSNAVARVVAAISSSLGGHGHVGVGHGCGHGGRGHGGGRGGGAADEACA